MEQPQGAPQPQQPEAQEPQGEEQVSGGVQGLIVGIHNNLLKFKELIGSVPEVPEQIKAQLDGVISGYKGVVDSIAGGGQQQPAPQPQAPAGPQPVSKGQMPMSGGKGAVPAL